LVDPGLCPIYFLLAEGDRVLSFARTIRATVSHLGRSFILYGLGDVITAPEWRRHGYGGRVVEEATAHIKSDREADAAVLLTGRELEAFYGQRGWECVRGLRVITSEGDGCAAEAAFPMMLFISAKARAARRHFTRDMLVLPGDEW
jgi:predicted N-acetyltransferase YhbS